MELLAAVTLISDFNTNYRPLSLVKDIIDSGIREPLQLAKIRSSLPPLKTSCDFRWQMSVMDDNNIDYEMPETWPEALTNRKATTKDFFIP